MVSDRFTYLIWSGLFLAFAWLFVGLSELFGTSWFRKGAVWTVLLGLVLFASWVWAVYRDATSDMVPDPAPGEVNHGD